MANYSWWQRAIAGEKIGGPTLPIYEGEPQPGFFRRRISRAGPYTGVAIFEHDGKLVAVQDKKAADPLEIWTWVAKYPITEAAYRQWESTGVWPDEDQGVTESLAVTAPPPNRESMLQAITDVVLPVGERLLGHNNPPQDEAEILKGQIDAASANMADYAEIRDDTGAAKAQSLRSRLLELSGTADKRRETEKAPHLEAGKAVDAKWQPLVRAAKAAADTLRSAMSAYETRKMQAEKVAAEAAAKAAAAKPAPKGAESAVLPATTTTAPVPEANTTVRGAYGRAASVKLVKVAVVKDQDAAYAAMRTHKELVELIAKLAQRATDAGIAIAGVEVEERRDVR